MGWRQTILIGKKENEANEKLENDFVITGHCYMHGVWVWKQRAAGNAGSRNPGAAVNAETVTGSNAETDAGEDGNI